MNGPLDENASADATPMIRPVVRSLALVRRGAPSSATGGDAVEAVMATSVCQG